MVKYSFNADMRSVFQRLAVANRHTAASTTRTKGPVKVANVIPFRPGAQQPRLEIADVSLRQGRHDSRDFAT